MPATIPAPLPKWSKWAIAFGATPSSYLVQVLDYLGQAATAEAENAGEWRHLQWIMEPAPTADSVDYATVTMDIANITGGGIDNSWTAQDYTTVGNILMTMWSAWNANMASGARLREIRWYRRAFNPYTNSKPFAPSGPPEHVTAGLAGPAGTSWLAPQTAVTHTEKTAYPKHWGRSYWPFPNGTMIESPGLIPTAKVDAWATAVHTAYDALQSAEFFPCVPTTTALGVPSRNLLGVTSVQVDNVLDVIRRRRVNRATYKKDLSL